MKQQVHELRLKDMVYRECQAKLTTKVSELAKTNSELTKKVAKLEKKAGDDCTTILRQVKCLE